MNNTLQQFDNWLSRSGPAALVIREHLMPVEGIDSPVFPPTFAAGDGFPGGYNIDPPPTKDEPWRTPNVCLMDSVGSQANRIEPIFCEGKYAELVPQIVIEAGEKKINLLEASHRAGDALVRCSALKEELHEAFQNLLSGDADFLARIAPTSLVFGVWDSRDTQAKLPRLVSSAVRAFDVRVLTRSAQFTPSTEFVSEGLLDEPKDRKSQEAYAKRGFVHVPATASHGGVIATGGVRRDATLSLAALHLLKSAEDEDKTLALRRYVLGLSLVALTADVPGYLRQGCNLVRDPSQEYEYAEVYRDGTRKPVKVSADSALAFAKEAAAAFGVGESRVVPFEKKRAREDVKKKD